MKILLVDDEYYILHGLQKLISSQFPSLEIHTADEVNAAKEVLYRERPDILITDIRIAEENGLDFVMDIRNDFPDLHVYIISGHSEFEYAKTAIQLNVRYYILKPISQEKVIQLIKKSIQEIEDAKVHMKDRIKNMELARKKLISDMIREGGCSQEIYGEVERLKLQELFHHYRVVNISVREYWMIATYHHSVQVSNLKMFMRQKIAAILENECKTNFLFVEDESGIYTVILNLCEEALSHMLHGIYDVINQEFKLYSEFRISGEHNGVEAFYEAYCESRGIAAQSSKMLFYSDQEGRTLRGLQEIRHRIVNIMREENYLQLASALELLIPRMNRTVTDDEIVRKFLAELYREAVVYLKEKNPNDWGNLSDTIEHNEMHSMVEIYLTLIKALRSYQQEVNFSKNKEIVKKVLAYMDEHIDNVTLENAADYVNITPIYLSIIFKEIEGINFKEYLIARKIDTAKRLLIETDYLIYEISAIVGYTDIKYFSRVFKRYVGIRPQEYRNQYFKKQEDPST